MAGVVTWQHLWPALGDLESRERELLRVTWALRLTLVAHAVLYGYFGWKRIGSEDFFYDIAGFLLSAVLIAGMRHRTRFCAGALAILSAVGLLAFFLLDHPHAQIAALLEATYLYFAVRGWRIGASEPHRGIQHG